FKNHRSSAGPGAGSRCAGELVYREVISIGPHAVVRIIAEFRVSGREMKFIAKISARWIVGLRYRDALGEGPGAAREGELGNHPPIRKRVVQDNGIPVVGRGALARKPGPDRIDVCRARE